MPETTQSKLPVMSVAGATAALVLLTAMNFVNFIDRYILPGVQELVKAEFKLSDERVGALTFWFFITYMCAAPVTGWLGDHFPRKPLIVISALLMSGMNLFTATVHSYFALNLRHAALGIGEASFSIYAPALLADFYEPDQRNRVLTIFYTAIPVGAACGYALGGALGGKYGWRTPFYVSAVPGIVIALLILFVMKEPVRGATDHLQENRDNDDSAARADSVGGKIKAVVAAVGKTIGGLAKNPQYLYATFGLAMVVFSLGGISAWVPSFLQRAGGYSSSAAGLIVGAVTVLGGLGGTAVGGWIAQQWLKTNKRALYLISAWSALLTVPPAVACFFGPRWAMVPGLAVALFFIFLGNGPLNAAIVNSVSGAIRSTAIALELFFIHALGDAPSPRLIGFVSDHTTLGTGLGLTLITMVVAAVLLFVGARTVSPGRTGWGRELGMSGPVLWHWALRAWVAQAWVVAGLWVWRGVGATFGLPKVPNLLDAEWDSSPTTGPMLTVVVPALNEEANVGACLESLLGQEYESLRIVAIDDRSTDETGAVMDGLAARYPERLRVLHVTELPPGWLGKTHAMAMAANASPREESEYLLFTDADIVFRPDALRRSMQYVAASSADHMVTLPTLILKRWDEGALISFFQVCAMWSSRLWKVPDPEAKRDVVGVGAFNLIRREAYEQVGGFEALRMAIIEDLGIAMRIRRAGLRQRAAFGKDLVSLHWASGALGVVNLLTKNMFSAFGFRLVLLFGACCGLVGMCVLPAVSLVASAWVPGLRAPAAITVLAVGLAYRALGRHTGISVWNAALSPFAAMLMIYAFLRSMFKTLTQGGVIWRGTFYPLRELRKHVAPLW